MVSATLFEIYEKNNFVIFNITILIIIIIKNIIIIYETTKALNW